MILSEVDEFASIAHKGQYYGLYEDYIEHPRRVAGRLSDPTMKAIALLHDVVEDTGVSLLDVRIRFGDEIADAVDSITRREGESYLDEYIVRVSKSYLATKVKIADLQENLYYAQYVNKSYASLIPRYIKALLYLEGINTWNSLF